MKSIQLIEIDDEGQLQTPLNHQFEQLPRIHEKIILKRDSGEQRLFEVRDIHYTENTINVYMSYVGNLNNVIGRIARDLV